ncbi:MAG: tRNA (N(6)-L-threonylcarbamoyladenosine(37)-C(2))-methylthiotransferase MtaB [Paramuribaculum sp.]|nr:tRNA (N(6)-L-threonylcarbamoyladenosine(37)-C(2))-methylthiotransferase MtaB [Paramuribaculum sp.]
MSASNNQSSVTALYHTFGCKLNFAETSAIASRLADSGITKATDGMVPDLIIINSCSVTEEADKKCRQTIRSYHRRYPDAAIVVYGCYAQLKPDEVASLEGVTIVAGADYKHHLPEIIVRWAEGDRMEKLKLITPTKDIRQFQPSCSRGDRTRYFLKVQDGCDYFCSYCTIPFARGRSRSGSIESLVEQARQVAAEGGKEIVITGVNIGDFGKRSGETFFDLVKALDKVEGIERYRISSIEPDLLTDDIIRFVAESKRFMPHFHIPLQAGNDEVLKLMRRHYDTELFSERINTIKELMPHAFIGVDVIAGSRGEKPELFASGMEFIKSLPISRLHVFPYSERPGTRAVTEIDYVVAQNEKHRRAALLGDISNQKLHEFHESFVGTIRPVLVEHSIKGSKMYGFTDNYIKVALPPCTGVANKVISVRLTENLGDEMKGEPVQ